MSDVIKSWRKKYPNYGHVSDDELTWRIGSKNPEALEQDEQFKKDFHRVNRPIKRARLKQEMSAVRKEAIKNDADFKQKYGPRTEEGNWYDQLTYGMAAGLNRIGEAGNKVLESAARSGAYKFSPAGLIHRLAAGKESVDRFQKAVGDQFKGAAEIAGEDAKMIDMVAGETQGAPFAKKLGEGAMSLIPSLAGGPAGIWGMSVGAGMHSYGGALADAERAYKAQGFSDEEAFNKAQAPALAQGLGTALITRGFGKTGVESILAPGMKSTFVNVSKAVVKGAGMEATEEWYDQLWQSVVRKMSYQPELTFEQAFGEMAEAGVIGGILGGAVSGVKAVEGEVKSKMLDRQMDKEITERGRAIALQESLPPGFAGEPEPKNIMDAPAAIPNLDADIPDVVGEGQKVTIKYKGPGGAEGVIESGPGTTREMIQRLLFNAKAGEVTGVRIDDAPKTQVIDVAAEPVEEEDEFEMTPAEKLAEAEAYPEEVIKEEAPPAPEPTPEPAPEPERGYEKNILEAARTAVNERFEKRKAEAQKVGEKEEEEYISPHNMLVRGQNPDDYKIETAPDYFSDKHKKQFEKIKDEQKEGPLSELTGDATTVPVDGAAVAREWADQLTQATPAYKEIADQETNVWEADQWKRDFQNWKYDQRDRQDREVAKKRRKEESIADVPDAERSFPDRNIGQFKGFDRTLAEISRGLRKQRNNLSGQKPYKGLTENQGRILDEFHKAVDAYGSLLNKDTTTDEQLLPAIKRVSFSNTTAVKDVLEKLNLPTLDNDELSRRIYRPEPEPEEAPGFEAQTYQGELSDAQVFQVQQYIEQQAKDGGFSPEENASYATVLELKDSRRVRKGAAGKGLQKIHDQQLEIEKRLNQQIKNYYDEILGDYPDQFKTQLTPDEPLFKQPLNEDDKDREATRPPVVEEPSRAPEGAGAGLSQESVGPEQIEGAPRPDSGQGAGAQPQPATEGTEREPSPGDRAGGRGEPDRPEGAEGGAPAPEPAVVEPVEGVGRASSGELTDPNHSIEPGDEIAPKGKKGKANANLAAIRLLKQLETENRPATSAEKKVLAKYTGWGGVKEVFEEGKAAAGNDPNWEKAWRPLYNVVREELTDLEYRRASGSILNAHYTSDEVIGEMWAGIRKLGFKGGRVLEPGAGIGHFFGLMPNDLAGNSHLTGVELDSISGRILAKLYPQAKIHQKGFEKANIAKASMDLIVGNVPFHKDGPIDKAYPKASLHNYYFLRGIDLLKPGGLMVAITSDSTMDNDVSKKSREWLAERADLVGAIRLPNDAFAKNAGTQVTTDILIFRKKDGMPFKDGNLFTRKAKTKTHKNEPIEVNQYFVDNPDMMLGQLSLESTMYGGGPAMAVLPHKGQELGPQIVEAFDKLPGEVFGSDPTINDFSEGVEATPGMKNNTLVLHEGKVAAVRDDALVAPEFRHAKTQGERARDYLGVKGVAQAINRMQLDPGASEEQIEAERKKLNKVYDAYVKKHGAFNSAKSRFLWEHDVEYSQIAALETIKSQWVPRIDKNGKARTVREDSYHKADIFNRRTVRPRLAPTSADTVGDALQISLSYKNGLDLGYMGGLLGVTPDKAKQSLLEQQLAFENPDNGRLETPEEYLSGHVKGKLRQAREAAKDNPAYERNVAELEAVQPAPVPLEKIGFRIGSQWISPKIIEGFVQDVLGTRSRVEHAEETGRWKVKAFGYGGSSANEVTYGFPGGGKLGTDLIDSALNMKQPKVMMPNPDNAKGSPVVDKTKTRQAQMKLEEIQLAFTDWAMKKPEVAQELFREYNERFNGTVDRKYREPTWRHYPGATDSIELFGHQKRAVSRILQGNTLLAHQVGTGKTYTMVTAAMEMRRLGIANKPMIVALNSTVEQIGRDFRNLYPQAKVLVPTEKQRDAKNRQRLMAMISTGDWDAVIIPHSFIDMMPDDPKREEAYINEEMDELKQAMIQAKLKEGGKSVRATSLQSAVKRLTTQLKKLHDRKVDAGMNFEQLGVDAMFVDEAHEFKKLSFASQMDSVKGLDRTPAQKASSLFLKSRWIMENNDGKNFVMATGTPVSNTIAEAWTMIRFLSPETLKEFEMERFDSFAGMFGSIFTEPELTAGGKWKLVQKFARFQNLPEFRRAWRTVADQVFTDEIPEIKLPPLKGGEVQNVVLERTEAVEEQIAKIQLMLEDFEKMSGQQKKDNTHIPLVASGLAKKATIDMRMIDPSLPDDPGSKVNKVVENVLQRYHANTDNKATQCIFCQNEKTHIDELEPHEQFNVYEEIKAKLIQGGVPEHEIAFVSGGMTGPQKRVFGEKMRAGQVRIAIGKTETLGTGLNIQERMVSLHHLDAPWRPMDIEQRNGRILRQGNMYADLDGVEILTYGMEKTLDAAIYQKLLIKAQATQSLMRGDDDMRVSDDAANEVEMTYEEQLAAFSGDERTMQRVGLGQTIRTLEMARSSFSSQQAKAREDIVKYEEELIPQLEERLEQEQELVARIPDKVESVEVDGNTYTDRKAIRIALDDYVTKQTEDAKAKQSKGVGAVVTTHHAATPFKVNGELLKVKIKGSYNPNAGDWVKGPDGKPAVQIQYQYDNPVLMSLVANFKSGQGFLQSMDSKLKEFQMHPEHTARELEGYRNNLPTLHEAVNKEWQRQKEYDDAVQKMSALDAEIKAEQDAAEKVQDAQDRGNAALDQIDEQKKKKPGGGGLPMGSSEAGFANFNILADLAIKGADLMRKGFSKFGSWSGAMKKVFGERVGRWLKNVWNKIQRQNHAKALNLSPEGLAGKHRIEGKREVEEEEKPDYAEERHRSWIRDYVTRQSKKVIYHGSPQLLKARQGLEMTHNYEQAALKSQASQLEEQLWKSRPEGFSLPGFLRTGPWKRRIKDFKGVALPLAAHLNVVGRDSEGNFLFEDFEMRAGLMSTAQFEEGGHKPGDTIMVSNPLTGEQDQLKIDKYIETPDGRKGFQLIRSMPADVQQELYNHFTTDEFPEFSWFIDMYIDPALKDTRQSVAGIEIPVFNRFSLASMMAENNPNFDPLDAYTPDVLVSRSLFGAVRKVLQLRTGTRSAGRKYKTGQSREDGKVLDLLSGFNVRALQAIQEQSRKRWLKQVIQHGKKFKGTTAPEGWVSLEQGVPEIWAAIKKLRGWSLPKDPITGEPVFPETEMRLQEQAEEEAFNKFKREAFQLRGSQVAIPRALLDTLVKQYASQQAHGPLYNALTWMLRNSKILFLGDPVTVVGNVVANDFFNLEAGFRYSTAGALKMLALDPKNAALNFRRARNLFVGQVFNRFMGARKYLPGPDSNFREAIETVLPDEIFADSTRLQDLKIRFDDKWWNLLKQGEIGGATMALIKYGNVDIRAKQRFAYAMLRADAVTQGKGKGLRGKALRSFVNEFMANPPMDARLAAINAAQFEMLNYADSPDFINDMVKNDWGTALSAFPRFGAAFINKQADRAAGLKRFIRGVPQGQRADALADVITFTMFGAGAIGLVGSGIAAFLRGEDEPPEEDARAVVGTSEILMDDGMGNVNRQRLDREYITANRMNISKWAELAGIDLDDDRDFWLRTRQFPVIGMAGAAVLAQNDYQKHGAAVAATTYAKQVTELAGEFLSVGWGVRIPLKAHSDWAAGKPAPSPVDPFAGGVPFKFYVVDELMGAFIPGQRQFDRAIAWVDPVYKRTARSKRMDYDPGPLEAVRASHLTGLIDRIGAQQGAWNPMLPKGKVEDEISLVPSSRMSPDRVPLWVEAQKLMRSDSAADRARVNQYKSVRNLTQPATGWKYRTEADKLALIPEANMVEVPLESRISSIFGLNLRAYDKKGYSEAIDATTPPTMPRRPR